MDSGRERFQKTSASEESGGQFGLDVVPSLPKGGGAISAISDGFKANPATGTATLAVALPFSRARALTPGLALAYDSGQGNSAFGMGWDVAVPRIARRLNRGLPSYDDGSDVFAIGGGEDLVAEIDAAGDPIVLEQDEAGTRWRIHRYRPRSEGAFLRVEHWRPIGGGASHWRSWSAGNVVSIYGLSAAARLADPDDATRIADWALDRQYDALGNVVEYLHKPEDGAGLTPWEAARRGGARVAGRYLKEIRYGNRTPYRGDPLPDTDFCFRTLLDYGEHDLATPELGEAAPWMLRDDPFSTYRAGFEARTRRLCRRVLSFHTFPELGADPVPVAGLELGFVGGDPGFSLIESIIKVGFGADGVAERMPPTRLRYSPFVSDAPVEDVTTDDALEPGFAAGRASWNDLFGEALPGRLSETAGALVFQRNTGGGRLANAAPLRVQSSLAGLGSVMTLDDPASGGRKALVARQDGLAGYFAIGPDDIPQPFRPFGHVPSLSPRGGALRATDLDGDGLSDMVMRDGDGLIWFPSLGRDGFDTPVRLALPRDEGATGPALLATDGAGAMFLADMTGDGLPDTVRVENASLRYWPNLGRGRFGAAVAMADAPVFDHADLFDPKRLRLVDIDGTGPSDILYVGTQATRFWLNRQGNRFGPAHSIAVPPGLGAAPDAVSVLDLKGDGTAGLVWSDPGAGNGRMRFLPLTGGIKPWLLERIENGMGGETSLGYRPSTAYYLADQASGTPWVTRLHFPVHCLASVTRRDRVTGLSFSSHMSYHHGYYDPVDREFRGFARVDQTDTESVEAGGLSPRALHQPPILTKSWFHTGAVLENGRLTEALAAEMFSHPALPRFDQSVELPDGLDPDDWRQAQRALRGAPLRSEVYALDDGALAGLPVSVSCPAYRVELRQPARAMPASKPAGGWPVFQRLSRGALEHAVDRRPTDARSSLSWVLDWNEYGAPLRQLSLGFARRQPDPDLPPDIQAAQARMSVTLSVTTEIAADDPAGIAVPANLLDAPNLRRLPLPCASEAWELTGVALPDRDAPVTAADLDALVAAAVNDKPFLTRDDAPGRRRLSAARSLYFNDALSAPLAFGQVGQMALPAHTETLAMTPDVIAAAFGARVSDADLAEAGYRKVHRADGTQEAGWWAVSGRPVFAGDAASRFYLPSGAEDAFGVLTEQFYDPHNLIVTRARNAALGHETRSVIDYRTLSPRALQDINLNWTVLRSDAFGRPVAVASMGKLPGVDAPSGLETFGEGDTLDHPGATYSYNSAAWLTDARPVSARALHYETHAAADDGPRRSLESVQYTGGFGQVVLSKSRTRGGPALHLVAPGQAETRDTGAAPRWIGNGRTVFNNKGQPLVVYEPYFTDTDAFDSDPALVETGAGTLMLYDSLGRALGQINADQSWFKQVITPWRSESWDAGDTLGIADPLGDTDVSGHFGGLPPERYAGDGWRGARLSGARGPEAAAAAQASQAYGATPAISHSDALGRGIFSLADNGGGQRYETRTEIDIQGRVWSVTDARGNQPMAYIHGQANPGGAALCQISAEAGTSRALADILGRPFLSWTAEDIRSRVYYDAVGRPLKTAVTEAGVTRVVGRALYGEAAPDAQARNLLGTVWKSWDSAGHNELHAADFKGNRLEASQRLLANPVLEVDWPEDMAARAALLAPETYVARSTFDALNRPTLDTAPYRDGMAASQTRPSYDEGGGLMAMEVRRGNGPFTRFVEEIDYDAKGQRQLIRYGNGVETRYEYDPESYRLTRLVTRRPSDDAVLQDLNYTYDIVGNITAIRDHAQQTSYFRNQVVEPVSRFSYDPLYRLTHATGREHIDQAGLPDWQSGWQGRAHREDGQRMRSYAQIYRFDPVGNLEQISHSAGAGSYTRILRYAANSNRLVEHERGGRIEQFAYTPSGAMTGMDHLAEMGWDFAGRLRRADKGSEGEVWFGYGGGGNRVRKTMIRADGRREERIYLGGLEVFRVADETGILLERETLHVSDDSSRIALLETLVVEDRQPVVVPEPLVRYQLGNHLGSAALELDGAGAVISYEEYHPYGTTAYFGVAAGREVPAKRYRYTGKERDEETGFGYHGARYYAPWLARWTSADPIGIEDGVNVYAYVGGRPVGSVDLSGTEEVDSSGIRYVPGTKVPILSSAAEIAAHSKRIGAQPGGPQGAYNSAIAAPQSPPDAERVAFNTKMDEDSAALQKNMERTRNQPVNISVGNDFLRGFAQGFDARTDSYSGTAGKWSSVFFNPFLDAKQAGEDIRNAGDDPSAKNVAWAGVSAGSTFVPALEIFDQSRRLRHVDDLDELFEGGVVTFGKRNRLAKNMQIEDRMFQAHHVVPWELRGHNVVQIGASRGFDMNDITNGIDLLEFKRINPNLAMRQAGLTASGAPTTAGTHANHPAYNAYVEELLNQFEAEHWSLIRDIDPWIARQFLERELIPHLKEETIKAASRGGTINDYFKTLTPDINKIIRQD